MVTSGDPVVLHLRDWRDLAPWSEFRMFIKDRRFSGVSQYHHRDLFPALARNYAPLAQVLADFADQVLAVLHIDDVVVDLAVHETSPGDFKTELIELNPFDKRTDPCLFSWDREGDFDQTFRIRLPPPSDL
nr:cell division cycle 123 family protein [Actibacterium sp. 188UL27-1]